MAAVDEIAIKLGVKTGELKSALADAGSDIKKFKHEGESSEDEGFLGQLKSVKHSMREFKELLVAGGMLEAIKGFFEFAIEEANKSTDATDKSANRVREFGKNLEEMKHVLGTAAVGTLGFFNLIGEKIGDLINMNKAFILGGQEGLEQLKKNEEAVEATGAAAEAQERRLAEVRKKNGEEFLSITKQLAEIEKKAEEQKLKGLDIYETERNIFIKLSGLRQDLANFDGTAIEKRRLILQIAQTQLLADDATLAVKKAQAEVEKKIADEKIKAQKEADEEEQKGQDAEAKAFLDRQAKVTLGQKEALEYFELKRKSLTGLSLQEHEHLAILELQVSQKRLQVSIDELHEKFLNGTLTPAESKRLDEMIKQTAQIEKQIDGKKAAANATLTVELPAEQALTAELMKQGEEEAKRRNAWDNWSKNSITQKGDVRNLDNTQLDQLVQNLNKQLGPIKQADSMVAGVGGMLGTYKSIEQLLLQQNLDQAQKEIEARRQFGQTQNFFGDDYAKRNYAPDDYARLYQLLNPDQMKKDSNNLGTIATGLQALFPDKFAGAIR